MQKTPYVFPIVGGRKVEHLMDNIAALDVRLGPEHYQKIESAVPFDVGFPVNMTVRVVSRWADAIRSRSHTFCGGSQGDGTDYSTGFKNGAVCDLWPRPEAIRPAPPN